MITTSSDPSPGRPSEPAAFATPARGSARYALVAGIGLLVVAASVALTVPDPPPPVVRFNRDIRPILSDRCFKCHGPDERARKKKLRLDIRDDATRDRGDGAAIVAGDPDASLLIQRIEAASADDRMPPLESKLTLEPSEIALLRRWIEEGAGYEQHWSFVAPESAEPPPLMSTLWTSSSWKTVSGSSP